MSDVAEKIRIDGCCVLVVRTFGRVPPTVRVRYASVTGESL
jgi:hypothetical protein